MGTAVRAARRAVDEGGAPCCRWKRGAAIEQQSLRAAVESSRGRTGGGCGRGRDGGGCCVDRQRR